MKRRALIAALAAGIVLASCGGSDSKPKSAPKSAKANGGTSAASPSVPATGPVFPLTGLSDSDGTGATRPVVTVKIPNNNVSPNLRTGAQQGLDQADVVYEEVVDGEITRFLAMFHSKTPERVGPVRSVRPMDPDVVWHVGGIFAYSGGAPNVVPLINAAPVNAVDESEAQASKALFRDRSVSRQTEFTLFANIKTLLTLGGTPAPPPAAFQYRDEDVASQGDPILAATIGFATNYGQPTWAWNETTKLFTRRYGSTPHVSGATPITAANIVVQFIRYDGGRGRTGAKGVVIGSGKAWILSDGKLVKGTWNR
ncbi:MAG: DUF3048 domain-containing protein, partial [Acidimicrobiia bacterium]